MACHLLRLRFTGARRITLHDTMWYLLVAETLELGRPRMARLISQQVKDGSIAYLLNKPYDFLLYQLASGMGESLPRMGILFILGSSLVWAMAGPPPTLANWPVALGALAGAWLLHFCFNGLIGLAAFVAEEVAPFEWYLPETRLHPGRDAHPAGFLPRLAASSGEIPAIRLYDVRPGASLRQSKYATLFSNPDRAGTLAGSARRNAGPGLLAWNAQAGNQRRPK